MYNLHQNLTQHLSVLDCIFCFKHFNMVFEQVGSWSIMKESTHFHNNNQTPISSRLDKIVPNDWKPFILDLWQGQNKKKKHSIIVRTLNQFFFFFFTLNISKEKNHSEMLFIQEITYPLIFNKETFIFLGLWSHKSMKCQATKYLNRHGWRSKL